MVDEALRVEEDRLLRRFRKTGVTAPVAQEFLKRPTRRENGQAHRNCKDPSAHDRSYRPLPSEPELSAGEWSQHDSGVPIASRLPEGAARAVPTCVEGTDVALFGACCGFSLWP